MSGLGVLVWVSTSSFRTGTIEGATTGSGIIAASLASTWRHPENAEQKNPKPEKRDLRVELCNSTLLRIH